jgi:RNA polymerase sigma-70 factor (ECF subfamily)
LADSAQARVLSWPDSLAGIRDRANDAIFEELVDLHYRRIYNLVFRMVRSEPDAADITQDTFVRAYRALPRLRAEAAVNTWIRRIAVNLCLDFIRKRNSIPPPASLDHHFGADGESGWDVIDPSGEPERLLSSKESVRLLNRAIETLPDDYRLVILLHHIDDMRVDEIAAAMRVPPGTIKSRLSRARRELRRKLFPFFGF